MRSPTAPAPRSQAERNRLIEQYLPLVRHVVARMNMRWPSATCAEDYFSAGVMGLMHAATTFDPNRGASFKTFAYTAIRGAILDEVRRLDPVPRSRRERLRQIDRATETLRARLDRRPTLEEIATELGLTTDELSDDLVAQQTAHMLSLDDNAGDAGATSLADLIACASTPGPDVTAQKNEMLERLARAISRLPDNERHVVVLYHYENLYLKEIGKVIGVTESRVCQVLARAHARLKLELTDQE